MEKKTKHRRKQPEHLTPFATPQEIQAVRQEIHELEGMLEEDRRLFPKNPKIQDEVAFRADILKKTQWLERMSPTKLRGEASNKAYREMKELERVLKEAMPTQRQCHRRAAGQKDSHLQYRNFEDAVARQIRFQTDPKLTEAAYRYKWLAARVDPSDPTLRNIERLRPGR